MNLFRKVRLALIGVACLMAAAPLAAATSPDDPATILNTAYLSYTLQDSQINTATNTVVAYNLGPGGSATTAKIVLTKKTSATTAKPGDSLTFTLTATNQGTGAANPTTITVDGSPVPYIFFEDSIPANTSLQSSSAGSGTTAVYHLTGTSAAEFYSKAPADRSTVDVVGFGVPALAAGATVSVSFAVQVHADAAGTINNTAIVLYGTGGSQTAISNTVITTLAPQAPTISFYNSSYSAVRTVGAVGSNLYLQGVAGACNTTAAAVDSVAIRIVSSLTLDDETFLAQETGVNTGVFKILPSVPTADIANKPVAINDGILEVTSGDKLTATMTCSGATVSAPMYLDPHGAVFDSKTNAMVSGATVTLIDVTGGGNGGHAGREATVFAADGTTVSPSTVVTGSDGAFRFPVVGPSTYKLSVTPPNGYKVPSKVAVTSLPQGHTIDTAGSYLGSFVVSAATGTVILDIPADPSTASGLFVEKAASKQSAEIGDFVDYTVQIANQTGAALSNAKITDTLPRGFRYAKGTGRIGTSGATEPTSTITAARQTIVFTVGAMTPGQVITLTYRAQVGPGTSVGKAQNSAVASAFNLAISSTSPLTSNTAIAVVTIGGGVFTDRGYIIGRITTVPPPCAWNYTPSSPTWVWDCAAQHGSGTKSVGVPGVRIFMEDGSYAISDENGNYSFYAVSAQTHVLKVDTYTIPTGSHLLAASTRNSGDGNTLFVDLKYGEMRRADFMLEDSPKLEAMIAERKAMFTEGTSSSEVDGLATGALSATPSSAITSPTRGASSGVIGGGKMRLMKGDPAPQADNPADIYVPLVNVGEKERAAEEQDVLKGLDPKLGFVNLKDGETVSLRKSFWVKGPLDSKFVLTVNGKEISDEQVGSRATMLTSKTEAWLYVGVPFATGGRNVVTLRQEGKSGEVSVAVFRPGTASKLRVSVPKHPGVADGSSLVPVTVEVLDEDGHRVADQTALTLQAAAGRWLAKDFDEKAPGVQTYVSNGYAIVNLRSPLEPADVKVTASIGKSMAETTVTFVPEARPMVAVGIVQYGFNFSKAPSSVVPTTGADSFEDSMNMAAATSGGRTAVYLKGKILGSDLLTLAYDSSKTSANSTMFRDVQPERYYPVYGDDSTKGFDAQSASKLYVRLDNGRNYLFYGDYQTGAISGAGTSGATNPNSVSSADTVLTSYSRTMTGARGHWENDKAAVTSFASYNSYNQVVSEIAADGTSGPYSFSNTNGVADSETVLLLHRDRNQPSVVLVTETQTRNQDYEFEPFTGRLLFKSPVPMLDSSGNPIYIRITYEVDSGGNRAWTGGVSAQYRVTNAWRVGGIAVDDRNSVDPNHLLGFNSSLDLPFHIHLSGELAETQHLEYGSGVGYRVVYKQDAKRLKVDFHIARTTATFDNLSSTFNQGSGEAGGKLSYQVDKKTNVIGEFARSENVTNGSTTVGGKIALERKLPQSLVVSLGMRYASSNTGGDAIVAAGTTDPNYDQTTVIARVSRRFESLHKSVFGLEVEQDVVSGDKHDVTITGNTPIPHGRIYGRYEMISSLGNQYALNNTQSNAATVVGIETDTIKKLHLFTEYREYDELTNRQSEAAAGLKETWKLNKNVSIGGSFETVKALSGWAGNKDGASATSGVATNSIAVTGSVSYLVSGIRGAARLEYRTSTTGHSFLTSFSGGKKITPQWTLLSRNILMFSTAINGSVPTQQTQVRFQTGAAYRGTDASKWDALALVEYRRESGNNITTNNDDLAVLSTHVNYRPTGKMQTTFSYATKWVLDNSENLSTSSYNQLFSAHVMHDLSKKFDVGVIASVLTNTGLSQRQNNFGAEIGYQLRPSLWISTGYNFLGFNEKDLPGGNDARQGVFARLRFKFDENVLKSLGRTKVIDAPRN